MAAYNPQEYENIKILVQASEALDGFLKRAVRRQRFRSSTGANFLFLSPKTVCTLLSAQGTNISTQTTYGCHVTIFGRNTRVQTGLGFCANFYSEDHHQNPGVRAA